MKKTLLLLTLGAFTWGFAQAQRPSQDGKKPNNSETKEVAPRPDFEKPKFPVHWGKPPLAQTKDLRPLPGGFGMGSSTLADWIKGNIAEDKENGKFPDNRKPYELSEIEKQNPKKIERETLEAVKEGKLSIKDARKKLDVLRKEMAKKGEFKRPVRPQRPAIPDDVKESMDSVKELEKSLHEEIKAKVEELGKDATREEIKVAVESFKETHMERFEEIKEKHEAIREKMEDSRPVKPERPELSDEVKAKVDALQEKGKEMHQAQKELHQNLIKVPEKTESK
tara:strand:+ start:1379 stop:2221 length:843 start_codon:yes stop_codon:yes gene_type:complete